MHELPTPGHVGVDETRVGKGELLAKKRRGITRYQITESIHRVSLPARQKLPEALVWVPLAELDTVTLSGPHRRWVTEILAAEKRKT
jgi:A/G-specific adenine glycosylase